KTTDRKEAERQEVKFRAEVYAEGVLGKKRSISIEQAINRLIASKADTPNSKNLSHHRAAVLSMLKGAGALSSLTNDDLERLKQNRLALGRAPQTVKHELNLVMQAVRNAKRLGFEVPDLIAPTIKVSATRLRYLSIDEEYRLLRELDPKRAVNGLAPVHSRDPKKIRNTQDNYDLVVMLLDTGARYNEIASLRWDQIDLDRALVRLWRSKVSNESLIFMTKRVREIIANRWNARSSKYLFSNSKGGARGYSVIAIRKAFHRAGLHDCTVHTLRHTHASRLIQHGMSVYEVKSVLGHADIRTTMRYAHLEQATVTSKARDLIEQIHGGSI
ncbi:MAG: site-specific integrase, partial [Devosia sp.]